MKTEQVIRSLGCLLAASLMLSGCVLTIEPLIPESEAVLDTRLPGNWENDEGSERASISQSGESGYAVEYTDQDGKSGLFQARLGRIGEHLILSVGPVFEEEDGIGPGTGLLITGHLPLVLEIEADRLKIAELDRDTLLAALRAGEVRLPYSYIDDKVILTGPVDTLRKTLAAYLKRDGALSEWQLWRRAPTLSP